MSINPYLLYQTLQAAPGSATHIVTDVEYGIRLVLVAVFENPPERKDEVDKAYEVSKSRLTRGRVFD